MAKYGNRKCTLEIRGEIFKFDSVVEQNRYLHLRLLALTNEISELELQPEYILQDSFKRNGKHWRREIYKGDFRYRVGDKIVVEDVKGGILTDLYMSKRKRLLFLHPELVFKEVYWKQKRWVEVIA